MQQRVCSLGVVSLGVVSLGLLPLLGCEEASGDGSSPGDPRATAGASSSGGAAGSTNGEPGGTGGDEGRWNGDAQTTSHTECNDGIDNDGDGLIDWQRDLGCANAADGDESAGPREEEGGFTTFEFPAESLVVYVSSSEGDDESDGFSPESALASIEKGVSLLRDGEHDFLLLRRGDTWRGAQLGRFLSGQDEGHPLVIASYGDSTARPRIEIDQNFIDHNGQSRSFVALLGLEFVSFAKVPGEAAFDGATGGGLRYVGGGEGLLVEDCRFLHGEIVVQSFGDHHYNGVEIRRNVVEQNYHVDTCGQNASYRPSGMYASHVDNLTIEGNVFDHNGWNESVETACATMYNHNMYLNADGLRIRDNVIARASSMGIKMRSDETGDANDLLFENNFLVDGEIGIGIGGNTDEPARFSNAVIRRNVFSQIGMGSPTDRDFSWMLDVADNTTTVIESNHFLHQPWFSNAFGVSLGSGSETDITVQGNVFYELQGRALRVRAETGWSNIAVTGNTFVDPSLDACLVDHEGSFDAVAYSNNEYSGSGDTWFCGDNGQQTLTDWQTTSGESGAAIWSGSFADPERTAASYAKHLDLGDTLEDYLAAACEQNRLTWQHELSAPAVNDYIRGGFE